MAFLFKLEVERVFVYVNLFIYSCQSHKEMRAWTDSKHQIPIGHNKCVYVLDHLNAFHLILSAFQVRPNGFFLCQTVQKYFQINSKGTNLKRHYA